MKKKGFIKWFTSIVVIAALFIFIIFFSGAAYVLGTSDIYAVINNDTEAVKFLLRNGADPSVRVGINHMTEYEGKPLEMKIAGMDAIELARYMSEMDKTKQDRSAIIELLTQK